jgi:ribosome small subunit-dependent GTPase A
VISSSATKSWCVPGRLATWTWSSSACRGVRCYSVARPGGDSRVKLLAANVDVGLVVLAPRENGPSLGFLERATAALRAGDIEPIVVVTKCDLLDEAGRRSIETALSLARPRRPGALRGGVRGRRPRSARAALSGRVAVVIGHSGVGKSTLLNALDPAAARVVGAVRSADGRGRHTTTASRLVPFRAQPEGPWGALVDTPGLRQLVPTGRRFGTYRGRTAELAPYLGRCRFRDCAHGRGARCALTEAAELDPRLRRALSASGASENRSDCSSARTRWIAATVASTARSSGARAQGLEFRASGRGGAVSEPLEGPRRTAMGTATTTLPRQGHAGSLTPSW